MTKYELKKASVEIMFKDRKNIKPGCTMDHDGDLFDEVVEVFDAKEDAMAALATKKTAIHKYSYVNTYFLVEEFFVEEAEYDEDGDYVCGGDIIEFSEMEDCDGIQ